MPNFEHVTERKERGAHCSFHLTRPKVEGPDNAAANALNEAFAKAMKTTERLSSFGCEGASADGPYLY